MAELRRVVVRVHVEILDHDHDHWCLTCLQATGVRVHRVVTAGVLSTFTTGLTCHECGGSNVMVVPDARHCA